MQNNEKEFLKAVQKKNARALKDISNDVYQLALTTNSTKMENEEKFQSNLVQGSFYITSISIGAKAFKKMIDAKQIDPECSNEMLYYFGEVINEMNQSNQLKKEAMEKKSEDS